MKFSSKALKLSKLAILGLTLTLSTSFVNEVSAAITKIDGTAAIVNGSIILESELNSEQNRIEQIAKENRIQMDEIASRRAAMENLITRTLLLEMAQNSGYDLNDMQLDQALAQTAANNNTTPEKLLASMGKGLSEAQAREKFKNEFLISEIRNSRVRSRINISEDEINNLAQNLQKKGNVEPSYNLGQVIIPLSLNPTEKEYMSTQNAAKNLVRSLRKGADFKEAQANYPSDQSIDLGYVPESQVPLPFVPALIKAKPGDIIGPFRSPSGLHILKVYDITKDAIVPIRTYDASHILLKTSIIFSDEAARSQLKQLRDDIVSGKITFANAAKQFSQDPGSAIDGGNLGYAVPDRYDPDFARALVKLKPGEISEPIKSSFGWHLIYLKDIKVDNNSTEAYKDRARSIIYKREFDQAARVWEKELRSNAYIQIKDPQLLSAAQSTM